MNRIGFFGGSFDPVHNGHLALARACLDAASLDEVHFAPTAVQPHKPTGPVASNEHRLEMLRLALAAEARFALDPIEIERGGVSYTVDTLRELTRSHADDEWYLLMGADTLTDLPNWRKPAEILSLATPLVVHRAGQPAPDFSVLASLVEESRWRQIADQQVDMPEVDISSSDIRRRIAEGSSIEGLAPPGVVQFITTSGVYR